MEWAKAPRALGGGIKSFSGRSRAGHAVDSILVAALCALIGSPMAQAQFRPDTAGIQLESLRERLEQAERLQKERSEALQRSRSASAHARMAEDGEFSAAASEVGWESAHPGVFGPGAGSWSNYSYTAVVPPYSRADSPLDLPIWRDVAPDDEPVSSLFADYISQPIVQAKCVNCHVAGGVAGATRLLLSRSTVEDHVELNRAVFANLVETVEGAVELILNKIQGVAHGGGMQVAAGTADFANMERFLRALENGGSTGGSGASTLSAQTLFDGVTMASSQDTLRRAAILFAGRLPTQRELDAVADGQEATLRRTIRGLMDGDAFHRFLIRAGNDRLLTDRQLDQGTINLDSHEFVELNAKFSEMATAALSRGYENRWDDPEYRSWERRIEAGFARAPLELIAHVIENNRPYTEILTADYIMANPMAAEGYGAATQFEDSDDPSEFRPSEIASYYRDDDSKVVEEDEATNIDVVVNPGNLSTDYPHAGILNTTAFLKRYPSTATNRNRARSRWTYYHFLGVDVEKSASRTTDPAALADTNNPTRNNPACTVCHTVLDPVAGAYQNYGDEGLYRDQHGGLDSLDGLYKEGAGSAQQIVEVEAQSYQSRETVSAVVPLSPGGLLGVQFVNDYWDEATGDDRNVYVDRLVVREQTSGNTIFEIELETLTERDLGEDDCDLATGPTHFAFYGGCRLRFEFDVPVDGRYEVEAVVWADQFGSELAKLAFRSVLYRDGDTWYRDMLQPGFAQDTAPDAANSAQWVAQRIVADPRFAEAAVKFWWQPIMGVEVRDPPEDSGDADFEANLVAATAQAAEVSRLADAFRTGIAGGRAYNGKDLLAEIALSPWFRAESVTGDDPARTVALRDAGMARLLTPEELDRKTEAVAGYVWGRGMDRETGEPFSRLNSIFSWDTAYELLYGGIDSDGVIARATDVTSVMAAVAQAHAVEVSCPIVRREFFLWDDAERRLFGGIDQYDSPVSEASGRFEVLAETYGTRETFSVEAPLTAGTKTVRLEFQNDYWGGEDQDRNVNIDRIELRDSSDAVAAALELEHLGSGGCGHPESPADSYYKLQHSGCQIEIEFDISQDDVYRLDIVAHQDRVGDEPARLYVSLESEAGGSAGAAAIRGKLVELHWKLLGVQVAPDSPDVNEAFNLFFSVWSRMRRTEGSNFNSSNFACGHDDIAYYDGIVEDPVVINEWGHYDFDWNRIDELYEQLDTSDPSYAVRAWVITLAYLMTDFRYLYF